MDLRWLEDFLLLARLRNFSRAAAEAHVTQSAFSRRIRALEQWLDAELVDRSSYPVRLTPAGNQFREQAEDIVYRLYAVRAEFNSDAAPHGRHLRFAAQHSLAWYFYPRWLQGLETRLGPLHARLRADNLPNCVQDLRDDEVDFVICFDNPGIRSFVDSTPFSYVIIGEDRLIPVCGAAADGAPLFALPGTRDARLPHLSFGPDAPLGWYVEPLLRRLGKQCFLRRHYENSMGESLRVMARAGHGVAWLPETLVGEDLAGGRLLRAGDASWDIRMDIRLYRNREHESAEVDRVWRVIAEAAG